MGRIEIDQIRKAEQRAVAAGIDLKALAQTSRDGAPADLASPQALTERREMLAETHGDQGVDTFERLIGGDELQPVNYLPHGVVAARSVCRIRMRDAAGRELGFATGFLIAPGVLLTNHHVFSTAAAARKSTAEFDVERDVFEQPKAIETFALNPERLFQTSDALDFSVVAVAPTSAGGVPLTKYGYLPLIDATGKAVEGEWLTIIQHPGGKEKQLCIRENKLLTRTEDVLWYSTDTLGGSSGSPVFNNGWQVVALHHKGVPETKNGVYQTLDGRDFDPARDDETAIKWIANEGIRISRLIDTLRQMAPNEPLLQPVFAMTLQLAQSVIDGFAHGIADAAGRGAAKPLQPAPPPSGPDIPPRTDRAMPARSITVTLDIADDGRVTVRQPGGGAQESFAVPGGGALALEAARKRAPDDTPVAYDVPFNPDYSKRGGFKPGFLGAGFEVQLPKLGVLADEAVKKPGSNDPYVLDYFGYSLVMHAERKFAIYTAANVDGSHRHQLDRPHDVWRYDTRIPQSAQIGDFYYTKNQFDRGHLTRREDMEYGKTPKLAIECAADTLHFTNCTPQHARFNENKQLWAGLEQHVLEQAIENAEFRAQVLTGPVLDPGDPRYKEIQYPVRFWKIAVARTSAGDLFAAGFVLDQTEVIEQYGVEAAVEVPFTAFKTFQVPIDEIERLTGLTFWSGSSGAGKSLNETDPLRSGSRARARASGPRRVSTAEAALGAPVSPPGYILLQSRADIVTG